MTASDHANVLGDNALRLRPRRCGRNSGNERRLFRPRSRRRVPSTLVGAAQRTDRGMTLVDLNRELVSAIPEPCSITVGGRLKLGEMGLIETITVVEGHATKAWCLIDSAFVHFAAMQDYIRDVLSGLPGLNGVTVAQSLTELWTPDRTSAA